MADLRPIAEAVVGGLLCLLYPALANEGHDLVAYAAHGGAWRYGARLVAGCVAVEIRTPALTERDRARALAWARREVHRG